MLTGYAAAIRTSKRSVSRHKRSTYSYYDTLTRISGGFVVSVDHRQNILQATEIIKLHVRVAQVGIVSIRRAGQCGHSAAGRLLFRPNMFVQWRRRDFEPRVHGMHVYEITHRSRNFYINITNWKTESCQIGVPGRWIFAEVRRTGLCPPPRQFHYCPQWLLPAGWYCF